MGLENLATSLRFLFAEADIGWQQAVGETGVAQPEKGLVVAAVDHLARTVREQFDIARMVRQVESLYGEVLQQ